MEEYSRTVEFLESVDARRKKLLALVLFISDRCNMKCKYCYNKFPRTEKDADLDLFFEFV